MSQFPSETGRIKCRVVYCLDAAYLEPGLVSIFSLILSAQKTVLTEILVLSVSDHELVLQEIDRIFQSLPGWLTISVLPIPEDDLAGLPTGHDGAAEIFSTSVYGRLLIANLAPSDWDRALYLDADTLVLRPITALFTLDLTDAPIAACLEYYSPTIDGPHGVRNWRKKKLNGEAAYFNSGVMLMNLSIWRSQDLGRKALGYARSNFNDILHLDQEALNAVLNGNFLTLDAVWNVTSFWRHEDRRVGVQAKILDDARIRHFTGPYKPWWPDTQDVPHVARYQELATQLAATQK